MKKFIELVRKETVLVIAWVLAIISAFFVKPNIKYIDYIDFRTLGILWSLMVIMEGLSCNGLFEMIDRASLLTSDRDKNTIKLVLKDNELIISSNSPEIGKVEEKMLVESSDKIEISFSSKYMLDSIKSFETDDITLFMNSDNSPIIIKSEEDDSLIQLVLPIKTY